jgi:hypothetical protein
VSRQNPASSTAVKLTLDDPAARPQRLENLVFRSLLNDRAILRNEQGWAGFADHPHTFRVKRLRKQDKKWDNL